MQLSVYQNKEIHSHPTSFFHNTDHFNNRLSRIKQKIDQLLNEIAMLDEPTINKQLTISSEYQNDNQKIVEKETDRQNCYSLRTNQKVSIDKITQEQNQKLTSIYNQLWEFNFICEKDQQNALTNTVQLRSFKQDLKTQRNRLERMFPLQKLLQLQNNKKNGYKKSQLKLQKNSFSNDKKNQQQNEDKIISQTIKQVHQNMSKKRIFKEEEEKNYNEDESKCHICSFKCQLI